jgi:hypothetical protein
MRPFPALVLSMLLPACDGGDDPCADEAIAFADADNFSFTGVVDLPSYPTVDGADVEICWDGVTDDIRCHDVDPTTDIKNLGLVRFALLTQEEVEEGLSTNSLQQSDASGFVQYLPVAGDTCALLSEFTLFGTPIDVAEQYTSEGGTYLLVLSPTTSLGVGALVLAFLAPTVGETIDHVDLEPGCGVLDFDVDLESVEPVPVCAEGPWTADWSGLTRDGQGNDIQLSNVDGLMLGLYEGATKAELETGFLDLETTATRLWTATVDSGQTTIHLGDATDEDGAAFPGFEGDGIWLFALRCSTCYNPAPLFLTFLEPTE